MKDDFEDYLVIARRTAYLIGKGNLLEEVRVAKVKGQKAQVMRKKENLNLEIKITKLLGNYEGTKRVGRVGLFKKSKAKEPTLIKILSVNDHQCQIEDLSGEFSSQTVNLNQVKMAAPSTLRALRSRSVERSSCWEDRIEKSNKATAAIFQEMFARQEKLREKEKAEQEEEKKKERVLQDKRDSDLSKFMVQSTATSVALLELIQSIKKKGNNEDSSREDKSEEKEES